MTIPQKRTLQHIPSPRGAPMGKASILPQDINAPITLRLELLPWVDGDYIADGTYFGCTHKNPRQAEPDDYIFWAYGDDEENQVEVFVRAADREDAMKQVAGMIPGAEFCPPQPDDIDDFTQAYIASALWTDCTTDRDPAFEGKGQSDIAPATLAAMIADCHQFQAENDLTDYPTQNAGHDLWLSRNHHGCGYFEVDFGTKEQCQKLTDAAHAMGEVHLYVGDDGKIYG